GRRPVDLQLLLLRRLQHRLAFAFHHHPQLLLRHQDRRRMLEVLGAAGKTPPGDPQPAAQLPHTHADRRLGRVQQTVQRIITSFAGREPTLAPHLDASVDAQAAPRTAALALFGLARRVLWRGKNSTPWSRSSSAPPSQRPVVATRPWHPAR